jgi:hypothetical protein
MSTTDASRSTTTALNVLCEASSWAGITISSPVRTQVANAPLPFIHSSGPRSSAASIPRPISPPCWPASPIILSTVSTSSCPGTSLYPTLSLSAHDLRSWTLCLTTGRHATDVNAAFRRRLHLSSRLFSSSRATTTPAPETAPGRLAHQTLWCRPAARYLRQSNAMGRSSEACPSSLKILEADKQTCVMELCCLGQFPCEACTRG